MAEELIRKPLTDEVWREYDFGGRVYRIENPVELAYRVDGTTHRVTDPNGVAHCLPMPGSGDCVLRWKSQEGKAAVAF